MGVVAILTNSKRMRWECQVCFCSCLSEKWELILVATHTPPDSTICEFKSSHTRILQVVQDSFSTFSRETAQCLFCGMRFSWAKVRIKSFCFASFSET